MFCTSCGKEVTEGSRFCHSCGASIFNSTPASVTQPLPNTSDAQNMQPAQNPYQTTNYYQTPQQSTNYQSELLQQPPYNQSMPTYPIPHHTLAFSNPYKELLMAISILGFLIAILCNCGLIKLCPQYLNIYGSEAQIYGFFPMWLLALVVAIAGNGNGTEEGNWVVNLFDVYGINIEPAIKIIPYVLLLMAILAFISFTSGCKVAGKTSMRGQLPPKQLRLLNTFLIVNWIFWLIYTTLILLPMIQFYNKTDEVFFLIEYTVCGYLYSACLLVITILKFVYSICIKKAYREYEQNKKNSPSQA